MQSFAPKFWCKFSLLLGPSPTISRQESKSCRTEDRVSGSSPQPNTFQEKYIHTLRQCITELDLISDQVHFKILLLGILPTDAKRLSKSLFTHFILGSTCQSEPIVMQTFAFLGSISQYKQIMKSESRTCGSRHQHQHQYQHQYKHQPPLGR